MNKNKQNLFNIFCKSIQMDNYNISNVNSIFKKVIKLSNKVKLSHDTFICNGKLYDFENKDTKANNSNEENKNDSLLSNYIPPCLHFSIYSNQLLGRTYLNKRYTPIEFINNNEFKLLIKVYKDLNSNIPIGKVAGYISQKVEENEIVNVTFPYGKFVYVGNGKFYHKNTNDNLVIKNINNWILKKHNSLGFIAAGTGITPIYRVINECFNREDSTNIKLIDMDKKERFPIHLIYVNYSDDELYLKNELETFANLNSNYYKLKILFVITGKQQRLNENTVYKNYEKLFNNNISYHYGSINKDILNNFFSSTINNNLNNNIKSSFDSKESNFAIYSCGSKPFCNFFLKPLLEESNYEHYFF